MDTGGQGSEVRETGVRETGVREAGLREAGVRKTGVREAGVREAGVSETGVREAGVRESGFTQATFLVGWEKPGHCSLLASLLLASSRKSSQAPGQSGVMSSKAFQVP